MNRIESLVVACAIVFFLPLLLSAQDRDVRGGRIVIDDNSADGGNNTLIIRAPGTLLQNSVLTIPNPGTGSANFILSESSGTQTINANLTFAGTINLPSTTLNLGLTANQLLFGDPASSGEIVQSANLVWNNTSNQLQITATSDPLRLNGLAEDNALTNIVVADGSGILHTRAVSSLPGGSSGWSLTGNSGTTAGTNFLGTTDGQALHFKANNVARLILNTNGSLQRDASGNARGSDAVDLQGVRTASTQVASGNESVIGGGEANTAGGALSVVAGGFSNTIASAAIYAALGGGQENLVSAAHAVIGGGRNDTVTVSGLYSVIGGGQNNKASWNHVVVGGGQGNTASGSHSVVDGGQTNIASGIYAAVGGGNSNTASGSYSVVGGGQSNTASGNHSVVGGGQENVVSGINSSILGGRSDTVQGDYSVIVGGRGLKLDASADRSFGFMGASSGSNNMTISTPNVAVFANANVWLASNDGFASEVRFYEGNSTTGAFPGTTNYTSFMAQPQTADIRYVLPATAGAMGDQLTISLTGTATFLSWAAPSDRGKKTDFHTLSGEDVLKKFRAFELGTWRYDPAIDPKGKRHYGIMAQDFHRAFGHDGIGEIGNDTTVSDLDLHGVAYLAIQGLEERTSKSVEEIDRLTTENAALRSEVHELRERLERLESVLTGDEARVRSGE